MSGRREQRPLGSHPGHPGSFCLHSLPLFPLQEEKEKRRLEQLERKKETQRLLEEEDSRLKGGKAPRVAPAKVTRAQIEDTLRREQRAEPGVHVARGKLPRASPSASFSYPVPVTHSGKG